jgi:hypothetical protein
MIWSWEFWHELNSLTEKGVPELQTWQHNEKNFA